MKKILALLMMFLVCGNLLFAQSEGTTPDEGTTAAVTVQPKLNFQAVVRDGNNQLVYSQDVSTVITITYNNGTYTETHPSVMTNQNGLLNLVIGEGEDVDGDLNEVDWSSATINAEITYTAPVVKEDGSTESQDMTISVETPVTAVPYALQAGATTLTTDMIVNYISGIQLGTNGTPDQKRDVLLILDAIRLNEHGLKNALKDTIVEYMKTRMDIAKEVFQYYLSHATAEDVQNTYDEVMANSVAHATILEVIKQFIKDHEADAIDIAKYYVDHITPAQLQSLYEEFHNNSVLESLTKTFVVHYLQEYLDDNYYVSLEGCPSVEICALGNQSLTTCPTNFIGTTTPTTNADGDIVLTTAINNPDNWNFQANYTYVLEGETHTVVAKKSGSDVTATIGILPAGTVVMLKTHIYGHDECDTEVTAYTF